MNLSDRERLVLRLMACGYTRGQIAYALRLAEPTVETYRNRIFRKLGAVSSAHAVALGMKNHQIDASDISSFPLLVCRENS